MKHGKCKYAGWGIAVLLLSLGCQSCVSHAISSGETVTEVGVEKAGGILRICDNETVEVLGYPPEMTSEVQLRHAAPAIETLLRMDEKGTPQGHLAKSCTEDRENRTLTIELRSGILFHDGTEFNAEAVKWNLDQQIGREAAGTSRIEEIVAEDSLTVKIFLKEWDNTLQDNLCMGLGLMISPTAFEKNGGAWWARRNPIGTGPFVLTGWQRSKKLVYEKNENYWQKGLPLLDGIEIITDTDYISRDFALRNQDYDVLIRGDITSLAGLLSEGYVLNSMSSGAGPWGLVFDSANEESPFSDLRVRQAVSHAVDVEKIGEEIYLDTVELTNQLSYRDNWSYNYQVKGYPYDKEKAKALLMEAGYPDGFSTVYTYNMMADRAEELAFALRDMLAEVNISLELNPVSDMVHSELLFGGVGWDGILGIHGSAYPDAVVQMYNSFVGDRQYRSMWKPADLMDSIWNAVTAPEQQRGEEIREAQRILVDEYCLITCMFIQKDMAVCAPYVHDTGLSKTVPCTQWTPELAWVGK